MTIKTTRILGMNIHIQYEEGADISDAVIHSNDGPILERIFRSTPITSIQYGSDRKSSWVQAALPVATTHFISEVDEQHLLSLIFQLVASRYSVHWFAEVVRFDGTHKTYVGGDSVAAKRQFSFGSSEAAESPVTCPPKTEDGELSDVCPEITATALRDTRLHMCERKAAFGAMLNHLVMLNKAGHTSFDIPAEMTMDVFDKDTFKGRKICVTRAAWRENAPELQRRGFNVGEANVISWE